MVKGVGSAKAWSVDGIIAATLLAGAPDGVRQHLPRRRMAAVKQQEGQQLLQAATFQGQTVRTGSDLEST